MLTLQGFYILECACGVLLLFFLLWDFCFINGFSRIDDACLVLFAHFSNFCTSSHSVLRIYIQLLKRLLIYICIFQGLEMGGGHTVEFYLLWLEAYVESLRKC